MIERDYELLSAYIDDALDDSERAELEARLESDVELRRELAALRQTVALVRSMPPLKAPRDFTLTAEQAGIQEITNSRRASARIVRFMPVLTAVAVIAVTFIGVVTLLTSSGSAIGNIFSDVISNFQQSSGDNSVAAVPTTALQSTISDQAGEQSGQGASAKTQVGQEEQSEIDDSDTQTSQQPFDSTDTLAAPAADTGVDPGIMSTTITQLYATSAAPLTQPGSDSSALTGFPTQAGTAAAFALPTQPMTASPTMPLAEIRLLEATDTPLSTATANAEIMAAQPTTPEEGMGGAVTEDTDAFMTESEFPEPTMSAEQRSASTAVRALSTEVLENEDNIQDTLIAPPGGLDEVQGLAAETRSITLTVTAIGLAVFITLRLILG